MTRRAGRSTRWGRRQGGMVTAETAVTIPAVLVVLAIALTGLAAGVDQVRCVEAARVAARALARGDPADRARALAAATAPPGARMVFSVDGRTATVTVSAGATLFGLTELALQSTAVADLEAVS